MTAKNNYEDDIMQISLYDIKWRRLIIQTTVTESIQKCSL